MRSLIELQPCTYRMDVRVIVTLCGAAVAVVVTLRLLKRWPSQFIEYMSNSSWDISVAC